MEIESVDMTEFLALSQKIIELNGKANILLDLL
jgi:hypothetical protein